MLVVIYHGILGKFKTNGLKLHTDVDCSLSADDLLGERS